MYIGEVARNARNIRVALSTIASLLQLTSYRYPLSEKVSDGATYDYIVVGAGTAGSVVANRLTEDPNVSVLLIEAGGDPPIESNLPGLSGYTLGTRLDWNHTSQVDSEAFQCLKNNQFHLGHGRVLGGSSSINSMLYVRGDPNDFNSWAGITGDQSWNYNNILPYFKKSERLEELSILNSPFAKFHGTKGNIGVTKIHYSKARRYLDSFKEMGYNVVLDTNGYNTLGFSEPLKIVSDGIRQSTANTFLSNIKERPNLHVMKDSLATKILIDKLKRARGVKVRDVNKKTVIVNAKREVILSAGAFNSPQLLMLSGIGPKAKLQKLKMNVIADLPVGEMQSHKAAVLVIKMGKSNDTTRPINPHEHPAAIIGGYVALNTSQSYPDYQALANFVSGKGLVAICSESLSFTDDICKYIHEETEGHDVLLFVLSNFDRRPRGQVSLKSLDPDDSPSIYMKPFPDEIDLEKYASYMQDISRIVNTTYFRSVGAKVIMLPKCKEFSTGKDYWRCYLKCLASTLYHYTSTCAMGSVVDSRLRVRGVKRLRVADASVMPTITSGNTMAPTVMIGEKAADMIKEDNRFRGYNYNG